jgi:hypothetical protein
MIPKKPKKSIAASIMQYVSDNALRAGMSKQEHAHWNSPAGKKSRQMPPTVESSIPDKKALAKVYDSLTKAIKRADTEGIVPGFRNREPFNDELIRELKLVRVKDKPIPKPMMETTINRSTGTTVNSSDRGTSIYNARTGQRSHHPDLDMRQQQYRSGYELHAKSGTPPKWNDINWGKDDLVDGLTMLERFLPKN